MTAPMMHIGPHRINPQPWQSPGLAAEAIGWPMRPPGIVKLRTAHVGLTGVIAGGLQGIEMTCQEQE